MKEKRRILLVEDSADDLTLMRAAMEGIIPNPVEVARDGKEAMKYLERNLSEPPYLVISDLKMPHFSGLDVLRWIRNTSELDGTIVLILSAASQDRDIEEAYRLRTNGYLIKPTTFTELKTLCRAIKDFWLLHNEGMA